MEGSGVGDHRAITRGVNNDDCLSTTRFSPADLSDIRVDVCPVMLLALWFFIGRHADARARVRLMCVPTHEEE